MIQQKNLKDTYEGRQEIKTLLKFIHDAAEGNLDKVKYKMLKSNASMSKHTGGYRDPYLMRFQYETQNHYEERIKLANCYGYTKIIADSYKFLFEGADKALTIEGASDDQIDQVVQDVDGNGTPLNAFAAKIFYNTLIDGVSFIGSDNTERPYLYSIPRASLKNMAYDENGLAFFIYETFKQKVEGIKAEQQECMYVFTREELAEFYEENDDYKLKQEVPNALERVPVVHCELSDTTPLMQPVASIDLNLMNLDSEMRSIIRNQAGLAFLVLPQEVDLDALTDTTVIQMPRGADIAKPDWIGYPASGLGAHFQYIEFLQNTLYEISRLRRQQKNQAESGLAKALDFTQTRAVLNAGADAVETAIEQSLKIYFQWLGQDVEVRYKVERNFELADFDDEIRQILSLQSIGLGQVAEAAAKKQFRNKYLKLTPEEMQESDQEIDNNDDNGFVLNGGIQ